MLFNSKAMSTIDTDYSYVAYKGSRTCIAQLYGVHVYIMPLVHIIPLVINSLGGNTHKHAYQIPRQKQLGVAGFVHASFNKMIISYHWSIATVYMWNVNVL